MLWLIGYIVVGILIAEGATYHKRLNPGATDFDITADVYSAIVLCWGLYLVSYVCSMCRK